MKPSLVTSGLRACALAAVFTLTGLASARAGQTAWTNLVSDIPGVARYPDVNLVNPMGVLPLPDGTVVVADNATGLLSVYNPTNIVGVSKYARPQSIAIPAASGISAPTGVVINRRAYLLKSSTTSFLIPVGSGSLASRFLVATEEGTVVGVTGTTAAIGYTNVGAVYKGLALSGTGGQDGQQLYLANFKAGTVDVLNEKFQPTSLSATTAYTFNNNPATAAGYKPFNVKAFALYHSRIFPYVFVTYALPDPATSGSDDLRGPGTQGNGYILAFDPVGNFKGVIATAGTTTIVSGTGVGTVTSGSSISAVTSPWGMAMIHHPGWANLFVGNVGDGTIQTFTLVIDAVGNIISTPSGPLVDVEGNTFQVDNLWGLHFGPYPQTWATFVFYPNEYYEDTGSLYFGAGIVGENHGLFGKIFSCQVEPLPPHFRFDPVRFRK